MRNRPGRGLGAGARPFIDQKKYFVLHAPRQTGKTSTLLALVDLLNSEGRYAAAYCNVEAAQVARNDVDPGIRAIRAELDAKATVARSRSSPICDS